MSDLNTILRPGSLAEALALMQERPEAVRPLAGGTSLIFNRPARTEVLLDLRRAGLDTLVCEADGWHLGPMLTLRALGRTLDQRLPEALKEAAESAGSRVLQNHITVGGNAVQVYAWSDLPVVLLALGARFTVQGPKARTLDAASFFSEHPTRKLGPGELLTEVTVKAAGPGSGSAYVKFRRTDMDHAMASVAAVLLVEDGRITSACLAAGALRGLPQLLPRAAEVLVSQTLGPEVLTEAGRAAAREAKITADHRATSEYRAQLLGALVEDAVSAAASRAALRGGAA